MADDGLDLFYADRLWNLLPALYRSGEDAMPLRELVVRLGHGIAAERRSIDALGRLGDVATADDWAIPYIADLVATRLVGSMDARAQRLDVARTIAYRRRAGTLGLIELLAFDVTGHDARAVEFFRRLGRTRHDFDPGFGASAEFLKGERLIGRASGTPAGGTANLRHVGAAQASTGAFDEFTHNADFRRPRQSFGHHAIPRIGVYLWWLHAFPIDGATPVRRAGCPNDFTFDPTGRETPLRASGGRDRETLGEAWRSPEPWEVPIAIDAALWRDAGALLYPDSLAVLLAGGGIPAPAPLADVAIDPERGRFRFPAGAPVGEVLSRYHHGFAGPIGAQGQPDTLPPVPDEPAQRVTVSGGVWGTALDGPVAQRTVLIDDSRTYPAAIGPIAIDAGGMLMLRAASGRRPLLRRTTRAKLTFTGAASDVRLVLRGIHLQGADLRLTGNFARVTIEQTTLDPGSLDAAGAVDHAIDGLALYPSRIIVLGQIGELVLDRVVSGPVETRYNGVVERLVVRDSIVQSIESAPAISLSAGTASFTRATILGAARLHRIEASDTIFDEAVTVDDAQHGCVRFCTYAAGSVLHAPYRSVAVPARSALFHSRRFGSPGYARLRDDADRAIPSPKPGQSIRAGGETGSETGAFASERAALKARSLLIKLEEYMPIGTIPVLIDAD